MKCIQNRIFRLNKIFSLLVLCLILLLSSCRHRINNNLKGNNINKNQEKKSLPEAQEHRYGNVVVKMRKENGVYHVPCKLNGVEMEFIFDTGASDITMSLTEATFLYKQGKLVNEDFIGKQQYQIADGSIHEGMLVILKDVEIGGWRLTNIQASIVDNMDAPLLLGQSALSSFGKISIDYKRNEITFE
jgi:aspartyl protease family protein